MSSFTYAATEISGTGAKERDFFLERLERYHVEWQKYGEREISEFQARQRSRQPGEETDPFDPSDYPRFIYEGLPLMDMLQASLRDVLMLAVWSIVFFMGAYLSFLRYDVR